MECISSGKQPVAAWCQQLALNLDWFIRYFSKPRKEKYILTLKPLDI
jgi:hypothetical protein